MESKDILEFVHKLENLKKTYRHSWISDGRQESVAEHTWRMSMMAILMSSKLDKKIDISKVLKMIAVHDLSEVDHGDMPAFKIEERKKHKLLEEETMRNLKAKYASPEMDEIYSIWKECEENITLEAKFVKALDKLEVRMQHDEADIKTWADIEYPRSLFITDKFCEYDSFLNKFADLVKTEAKSKISSESDKDIKEIEKEAFMLKKK